MLKTNKKTPKILLERWNTSQKTRREGFKEKGLHEISVVVTTKTRDKIITLQGGDPKSKDTPRKRLKRSRGEVIDMLANEDRLFELGYVNADKLERALTKRLQAQVLDELRFRVEVWGFPKTVKELSGLVSDSLIYVDFTYCVEDLTRELLYTDQ